jgi:CHAD domain-containing protein
VLDKEPVRFALTGALKPEILRDEWSVEVHPRESMALTFWDTFEWGLWFGGHVLYRHGKVYRLCSRKDSWLGAVVAEEQVTGPRRFWWEFGNELMRDLLQGMLGLRGLAPVAEGIVCRHMWDLRNAMGKVVCRLECSTVTECEPGRAELFHSCLVIPLIGYEAEAARLVDRLSQQGAVATEDGPLPVLLRHAGREPRPYTLRPAFGLEFDTPAREAVGRIVRPILALAEQNLPGILQDLDTEFLHDYRICLRKTRSVLSLVKDLYPPAETQRTKANLGDLARRTNRLRDLDVYLLAREEYLGLLPPRLRPALGQMFTDFSAQRAREVKRTVSALQAPATRQITREIEEFFSPLARHAPAPAADLPVGPLIYQRIYKNFKKIRRIASSIGVDTPDERVHELRIECKKLRYLLEFFSELVPEKSFALLVKPLKRLQNWLGEFNDASVQQNSLLEYWDRKGSGADVALGLGGLVSLLYERQRRTRHYIFEALQEFCGTASAARFKRTFKLPASLSTAHAKGFPEL